MTAKNEFSTPAEMAFAQLLERIRQDVSLSDTLKQVICEDLTSSKPESFERLNAVLAAETKKKA